MAEINLYQCVRLQAKKDKNQKEGLSTFLSQNTKTVCSISGLMGLATITQPLEEKSFADG